MEQSRKKNKAVALRYNGEEDMAPIIIAAGYGNMAEKIIDIAEQEGIPVFRDDSAASLLCMLEVGNTIPVELYQVVATIYKNLVMMSSDIKGKQLKIQDDKVLERNRRLQIMSNPGEKRTSQ